MCNSLIKSEVEGASLAVQLVKRKVEHIFMFNSYFYFLFFDPLIHFLCPLSLLIGLFDSVLSPCPSTLSPCWQGTRTSDEKLLEFIGMLDVMALVWMRMTDLHPTVLQVSHGPSKRLLVIAGQAMSVNSWRTETASPPTHNYPNLLLPTPWAAFLEVRVMVKGAESFSFFRKTTKGVIFIYSVRKRYWSIKIFGASR